MLESFRALVDATFTVHLESGDTAQVVLSNVRALPVGGPRDEPFALDFVGTGGALGQGTYEFEDPTGARSAIFIVPLGPDPAGNMRYEAVFN
jgi:hypothetical protein